MTPNKKIWWLLSIPSSGNLKNLWPMSLPWHSFTGFTEAFGVFCFIFLTYCFWLCWYPASPHILLSVKHFIYMHIFKFLRKRNPVFSLLCVFVLLLYDLCCHVWMSVQGDQTDGKWAAYYTIFLGLWIAYQTWGWSFHIFLTRWWGF